MRKFFVQTAQTVGAVGQRFPIFRVFSRVYEAAVNQSVGGEDGGVGFGHVRRDPVPDAVGISFEIFSREQEDGWHEDGISGFFRRVDGVGKAHGPVVLRDEKNRFGGNGEAAERKGKSDGAGEQMTEFHKFLL